IPAREREAEWLQQTAAGDRAAFERLYTTYHRRLCGYLFRMVGSREAVDELVSDVMLDVWKGAGRFRGSSQVSTWIFGIARHKALSFLRRGKPVTVEIDEAMQIPSGGQLPDEALADIDTSAAINRALAKLTEQHREVLDLTFYQGFSCSEIAEILQCPLNTVKTRLFYARKQMKEFLAGGVTI
ncbi:MAG TPA: sigma-70 family RNA polymerase sigma factor, partial [Terriglobia bacterium]|nr:sigma-70 family RNA polymerase sigma factor [Terriglobia bacterium]